MGGAGGGGGGAGRGVGGGGRSQVCVLQEIKTRLIEYVEVLEYRLASRFLAHEYIFGLIYLGGDETTATGVGVVGYHDFTMCVFYFLFWGAFSYTCIYQFS